MYAFLLLLLLLLRNNYICVFVLCLYWYCRSKRYVEHGVLELEIQPKLLQV